MFSSSFETIFFLIHLNIMNFKIIILTYNKYTEIFFIKLTEIKNTFITV